LTAVVVQVSEDIRMNYAFHLYGCDWEGGVLSLFAGYSLNQKDWIAKPPKGVARNDGVGFSQCTDEEVRRGCQLSLA